MKRTNTSGDVAATGLVQVDAGTGVTFSIPVNPSSPNDADWQTFTADGSSSTAGSTYELLRMGNTVLMNVTGLVAGATSNGVWASVPYGYRPAGDAARLVDTSVAAITNPPATVTIAASTGSLYARDRVGSSLAAGTTLDGVIEWTTLDPAPAP